MDAHLQQLLPAVFTCVVANKLSVSAFEVQSYVELLLVMILDMCLSSVCIWAHACDICPNISLIRHNVTLRIIGLFEIWQQKS
jgi:hypothetical protein